jgi:hypothetical protein
LPQAGIGAAERRRTFGDPWLVRGRRLEEATDMCRVAWLLTAAVPVFLLGGCTPTQRQIEQQNKAVVNRFGEASNARDFNAVR